jgi:hypothetical protein
MFGSRKVMFLMVILFVSTCIGIAGAQKLNKSLEEKTRMPINKVLENPNESVIKIVSDYFTEALNQKDVGIKLIDFDIVKVNSDDLNDIKVSVIFKYENDLVSPAIEYSVTPINNNYQVVKQVCVYNLISDSPDYGTLKGCTKAVNDNQTTLQSYKD